MSIVVCTHQEDSAQGALELALEESLAQDDQLIVVDFQETGGSPVLPGGPTALSAEEFDVLGHHQVAAALREASSLGVTASAFSAEGLPESDVVTFVDSHAPRLVLLAEDEAGRLRFLGAEGAPVKVAPQTSFRD